MSITVKDCLFLPTLSLGYVAAGENGLNNIVNRIDVIEFILDEDEFETPKVSISRLGTASARAL